MNNNMDINNGMSSNTTLNANFNNSAPVETLSDNVFKKDRRKLLKKIIFIILIVLILAGVGFYIYKETVILNKTTVVKTSIGQLFNIMNSNVDNIEKNIIPFDANEEPIGIEGTIKASSNYSDNSVDLTKLSNYTIYFNQAIDLKSNKLSGRVALNNKDNYTLLSLSTYLSGQYGLVESTQLSYYAYNYNIGREIKDIKVNNKGFNDNIKKMISRTKEYTLSTLDENKITKDTVETAINGSNGTFTRFTYKVNMNEYINSVLKFYITDTSVLNTIAELSNTDSEQVKSVIQSIVDNNNGSETYNYEVYLDSWFGKFKQIKIYNETTPNKFFKIYQSDNGYKFELKDGDKVLLSGKYANNKIEMNNDSLKIEGEKLNDNEFKFGISTNDNDYKYEYMVSVKTKVESDKQNTLIKFYYNLNGVDLTIEVDFNITKEATVRPISSFINKDISTIDEAELESISTKLENILTPIMSEIYKGNYNNSNLNNLLSI